jgi:hypothetical protein
MLKQIIDLLILCFMAFAGVRLARSMLKAKSRGYIRLGGDGGATYTYRGKELALGLRLGVLSVFTWLLILIAYVYFVFIKN